MNSRRVLLGFLVFLFANTALVLGQSQATTGVIQGTVSSESGEPLPGAQVTMRNTATNFELDSVTDSNGRFRGVLLPLGPYQVTAQLEGFSTVVRDGIRVTVGKVVVLPLVLKVSQVAEELRVEARPTAVGSAVAENITQINEASIEGLPNNGRNFLDFLTMTAGVNTVQGPDGEVISVNGQKGINNNISLDGTDFNNPFFGEQRGGQRPPFTFNLDAVQEVLVVSEGAPAEYGRASAGFIKIITKSGTNDLAGSAHFFFKNDSLNGRAENPDGTRANKFDFDQQQLGFTYGGPLIKDKAFYFVTLDTQQFSETKQTDGSRIDPALVDLFTTLGSPNENGPIERTDDAWAFSVKFDFNLNPRNHLTLRLNATDSEQVNGTFDVDSWGRSANAEELDETRGFSGAWNAYLSDSLYNELRFNWSREERPRPYNGPNIAGESRPLPDTAFDFDNSYRFGMPFFIPVSYHDTRFQINENLTIVKGNHLIKVGAELNLTNAAQTFVGFANGRYIFNSTQGFLNYVANPLYIECSDGSSNVTGACPTGTDPTGPILLYLQQAGVGNLTAADAGTQALETTEIGLFIQDHWNVNENLSLQYGLRWESQDNPDVITPPDEVFFAEFIGTSQDGQEFPSDGTIPDDDSMFQPRFGLTWDPEGNRKSVVRFNAGVFHARIPGLVLASTRSTNGSRGQTLFRNHEASPFLGLPPAYPDLIPQSQIGDPFRPDVFVTSRDFRNPKTTTASFAYEREVVTDWVLSLKYVYSKGKYQTRFVNRNDPKLRSDFEQNPDNPDGPWSNGLTSGAGVGALTSVESTGESLYRGYTFSINKLMSNNYQFQLNYTYSKDKSHDDNERDPFTFRYADVRFLDAEWGLSDRDQRHRFNGWILYEASHGIQVNARFSYRSAQPKSITADGSDAATPQDRINPDGSITERNLGKKNNEFRSLDLRISKLFDLRGIQLEPILEIFNVTNSRNLLTPEVTNLIFNFDGTVQSGAGSPRQVQLGVKGRW